VIAARAAGESVIERPRPAATLLRRQDAQMIDQPVKCSGSSRHLAMPALWRPALSTMRRSVCCGGWFASMSITVYGE